MNICDYLSTWNQKYLGNWRIWLFPENILNAGGQSQKLAKSVTPRVFKVETSYFTSSHMTVGPTTFIAWIIDTVNLSTNGGWFKKVAIWLEIGWGAKYFTIMKSEAPNQLGISQILQHWSWTWLIGEIWDWFNQYWSYVIGLGWLVSNLDKCIRQSQNCQNSV